MDDRISMDELFHITVSKGASDLHLASGIPPHIRIYGELTALDLPVLNSEIIEKLIYAILDTADAEKLKTDRELDFSYFIPSLARFRGNAMYQRDSLSVVFRVIPMEISALKDLGLSKEIAGLCDLKDGLVLITGPSGSGKSTTLAAMIDMINNTKKRNIITVEDPIEFLHNHNKSIIRQREVGRDTYSFDIALRHALRHDPDILLIGEMRDLESVSTALTAAETGHLVFSTLHTPTAPLTISRIIDIFQVDQREKVRHQLVNSIRAIVSQRLIPKMEGGGRVLAYELMLSTSAVKNTIREGREHQLYNLIQTGSQVGMQTMDQALVALYLEGIISRENAFENCIDKDELERIIKARGDFF